MAFLVRRISNLTPWPDGQCKIFTSVDDINADAFSKDFSTTKNTLSLWKIDSLDDLNSIAASIISVFNIKTSIVNLILLPYDEVDGNFTINNSPSQANTAIVGMNDKHYDIQNLNYKSFGNLIELIAKITSNPQRELVKRIKFKTLIPILEEFKTKGLLDNTKLGDCIKKELNID